MPQHTVWEESVPFNVTSLAPRLPEFKIPYRTCCVKDEADDTHSPESFGGWPVPSISLSH